MEPNASTAVEHQKQHQDHASANGRELLRDIALRNAIRKRAGGVPTYSVPEAAALLSISQEYLYRLIQAGGFPAVRMRIGSKQGRYVVPAKAVEQLLNHAANGGTCIEADEWTAAWENKTAGGAA
jgi:excisionase family DNA binding protein